MKKILITTIFISFLPYQAMGGFSLGLGKAVAKQGNKVFEKALEKDNAAATDQNYSEDISLPSCGSTLPFTVSPVDTVDITGIDPLGHVNPSAHTFPSDHIYFYLQPADSNAPTGLRVTAALKAPANIHVTGISSAYTNGNTANIDYGVTFYACRELKSYFTHIHDLSPAVLAQYNASPKTCQDYSTGGTSYHRCEANTNFSLTAGDDMATVGNNAAAFDFGSYDYRRTPLAFLAPTHAYFDRPYTVCPLDYFESSMKSTLEGFLGRWDGAVRRTDAPLCGQILFDVPGTASGDWYKIGAPISPEDPHLSLIPDNVIPTKLNISIGTSVSGVSSTFYGFLPLSSGTHNRDFSGVTSDGQVYCYDTFLDPLGQVAWTGFSLLISMPTSTTLSMEKWGAASCGSGPWTLDSSATLFQR